MSLMGRIPWSPFSVWAQSSHAAPCRFIAVLCHAQAELREVRRYLLYCRGLKYKKETQQIAFWQEHVQLGEYTQSAQRPCLTLLLPTTLTRSHPHRPLMGALPTVQCRAAPARIRADR